MKKDKALGNAFMDVALAGAVLATIGIVVDLVTGGDVKMTLIGAGLITYAAYIVAAIRLGVSPVGYLRGVGKRSDR